MSISKLRAGTVVLLAVLCLLLVPGTSRAAPPPPPLPGCATGVVPSGAFSLVCSHVHRFAQKAALAALQPYETSGDLTRPLVTLHTLGDQVIPYALHEPTYLAKVLGQGAGAFLTQSAVPAYGHCDFTTSDLLGAFGTLRLKGGF